MQYYLKHNPTGEKFIMDFFPVDFNIDVNPNNGLFPTIEQCQRQIAIWNRAEKNYKNEFTYSLKEM